MKTLFKTYGELFAPSDYLTQEMTDTLKSLILKSFDLFEPPEDMLTSDLQSGVYATGGYIYLVEDLDDLEDMIEECGMDDIKESPEPLSIGIDVCMFLDKAETVALIQMIVSDAGGPSYIISANVVADYPAIAEHILRNNT